MPLRAAQGYSIVELLASACITLCLAAALFGAVHSAEGVFTVESEAADMQQRLRVATAALLNDLVLAGAGTDTGSDAGPLIDFLPPIVPYRRARTGGDPAGAFRRDVITLMHVPSLRAQTTSASAMAAASGALRVNVGAGCPLTDVVCGLTSARTVLIYDSSGSFDPFRIDGVQGSSVELHHTIADSPKVYPAGSRIVEAIVRSYFLEADATAETYQLMRDDGDGNRSVPVVDHVVRLEFAYFGDPRPPVRPPPPDRDQQPTSFPPGENCVIVRDALGRATPRLPLLVPTEKDGLTALTAPTLTDGPWCPDEEASNRFDADLLRIRRLVVTLGVQSALEALRGPASALFSRPGTSKSGSRFLPDWTARFHVSPRNMIVSP